MKTLAIYPDTCALAGYMIINAFIEGLKKTGDKYIVCKNNEYIENAIPVMWSVLWTKPQRKKIWDHYKSQGEHVIVLEVGSLVRNFTWKVAVDGINYTAEFANENSPPDRWKSLGIQMKPWRKSGDNIIICCQNSRSHTWAYNDQTVWVNNIIEEITTYTSKNIYVRPHPRCPIRESAVSRKARILRPVYVGGYDDFDFTNSLEGCWAVINPNSNPAIESIINGIPAFVDSTSMASPVANPVNNMSMITDPEMPDREQWAHDLAYSEWTKDEIADGIPWKRLRDLEILSQFC